MRIFPAITEPEHTKILLDIYGRKKHLDGLNKQINKIAQLNHDLIKQEKLGPYKDPNIIQEKKAAIMKEEEKLMSSHKDLCIKREQLTNDCS